MITIRHMTAEDIPVVAKMAEALSHESGLYGRFSYERLRNTVLATLHEPTRYLGLLALDDGEPIGSLGGYIVQHFATDILIAHDLSVYVMPEHRGRTNAASQLIEQYVAWAKANGADRITLANGAKVTDSRVYDRLMKRVGFAPVGAFYAYEA